MKSRLSLLATFCLVAPVVCAALAAIVWAADTVVEQHQRAQIDEFSRRALVRAELVTADAEAALRTLTTDNNTPCTPDHLQAMRHVEEQYRYVRNVAWTDGETIRCSTLHGLTASALPPAQWNYNNGFSAWSTESGKRGNETRMLNIRYGSHIVVVDPRFYLDIVPLDDTIELALFESLEGAIVTSWPRADAALMRAALYREPAVSFHEQRYYVVIRSQRYPLAVVAYEPSDRVRPDFAAQFRFFLAPALLASALGTWLILRWRRKLRTPRHVLLEGIRQRQFTAWFQPLVDLRTGRCVGAEALVRWTLADGTVIAPDTFIPMAELLGMIQPITDLVIESVFAGAGNLLVRRRDLHISINLTRDDLISSRFLHTLKACFAKHDVRAEQIWFECIERAFIDAQQLGPVLQSYRDAGHKVFIDDFGTGYSSLAYLHALPVDGIKIDKSFINALTSGSEVNAIVPHIIGIAHELKLAMVAEGVEIEAQAAYLREHGVQFAQGWLYAKAMPAAQFVRWVEQNAVNAA
ncbi:sensor c-di-GMP phosphodiesterase-like protein [Paraburkholderia bannensis]|uniref:cyclic-guanylate-specific phosphodiesterase n=1 Tax=Paraburkholderia bannensis TaxID=765414 RepID=A0A7W9TVK0_9BURK|nr:MULTISPECIES: EAL domain-containing protein [Paraburkholderia]MBB3257378.1 sensor c-di-GMP phosphodiesterase-like protein [Paraburkholderia sp. WP4_3_2]MBB6102226.1 sensor c-di-GMP phosphodiesterase-like protein [Paraburkholderia bannensis]